MEMLNRTPSSSNATSRGCAGFIVFLGIFFSVPGGLMAYSAIRGWMKPERPDWLIPTTIAAIVFLAIGVTLTLVSQTVARNNRTRTLQQHAHPDAPWLWQDDWAAGVILSRAGSALALTWLFAIFWIAIVAGGFTMLLPTLIDSGARALFLAPFPLIGVVLVINAVRQSFEYRGRARFMSDRLPGVLGGSLRGSIALETSLAPDAIVTLELQLRESITTGHGKRRHTETYVRWSDVRTVPASSTSPSLRGSVVPVDIAIPYDLQPTSTDNSEESFSWRLLVRSTVGPRTTTDVFIVPVFHTQESDATRTRDVVESQRPPGPPAAASRAQSRMIVRTTMDNGTEFVFPPLRRVAPVARSLLFALLFGAAAVAFVVNSLSWIFAGIAGLISFFLFANLAWLLSGETAIRIERAQVACRRSYLGSTKNRIYAPGDVQAFAVDIPASTKRNADDPCSVRMRLRDGGEITVAYDLPDRESAEEVASQLREALQRSIERGGTPSGA